MPCPNVCNGERIELVGRQAVRGQFPTVALTSQFAEKRPLTRRPALYS